MRRTILITSLGGAGHRVRRWPLVSHARPRPARSRHPSPAPAARPWPPPPPTGSSTAPPPTRSLHRVHGDTLVAHAVSCRARAACSTSRTSAPTAGLPVVGGDAGRHHRRGRARCAAPRSRRPPIIAVGTDARRSAPTRRWPPPEAQLATVEPCRRAAAGRARLGQPAAGLGGRSSTGAHRRRQPSKLHVFVDAADRRGRRQRRRRARRHRQRLLQRQRHHQHLRLGHLVLDGRPDPARHPLRRPERHHVHRHRRRLGQRLRHQPRDRLRRRALRVQQEWDMLGQWLGRNGINGSGGGFPARVGLNQVNAFWNGSYTNFGRNSGQHPAGHADRRGGARVRPRHLPDHPRRRGQRQRERRPQRGHRRHLRRADRGVRQQPERPAGLPGRRGGQPRRQRPDPQHVQPVGGRRPELLVHRRSPTPRCTPRPARSTTGSTCCRGLATRRRQARPARPATARRRSPASASRRPARSSTTRCWRRPRPGATPTSGRHR